MSLVIGREGIVETDREKAEKGWNKQFLYAVDSSLHSPFKNDSVCHDSKKKTINYATEPEQVTRYTY